MMDKDIHEKTGAKNVKKTVDLLLDMITAREQCMNSV
jgi:hypothetical protein